MSILRNLINGGWQRGVATGLLIGPWLLPPTFGPSPAVVGSIFATAVVAAYMCLVAKSRGSCDGVIQLSWLIAGLLSALAALSQYFGVAASMGPWVSQAPIGEAFANLRQRNQFATLTNIALAVLLVSGWPKAGKLRYGLVVLLVVANAASASRTGFLQLCALVLMSRDPHVKALAFWRNRAVLVAVVTYSVSTLVFLALGELQQAGGGILTRAQNSTPNCSSRLVLWSNVLHLIAQKPWTGWGWGELSHAHFITRYPGDRFCEILDNAHNLPLHLAVELGVPIAVAVCGALVWWVVRNKPLAESNGTRQLAWGVLAIISLHSLLEYPLWYGPFQMAVVLCLVLLKCNPNNVSRGTPKQGCANISGEPDMGSKPPSFQTLVTFCSMAALTVCGYVGWDYWRISQLYLAPATRAEAYRDDTYDKVKDTWLFQNQVQFADLTTKPLEPSNAAERNAQAKKLLHFSPEPRVVEAIIESAVMLGNDKEALYYLQRYKAAFPEAHAAWAAASIRYKAP